MDSLEYSKEALEAKGLFYNKKLTVYVEGQDDVLFWSYLFDIADIDAHIEEVGGKKEIEKYITNILEDEAGFFVACDLDHSDFFDEPIVHTHIIKTYGYSIENSMYNFTSIGNIVSKLGRKQINIFEIIEKWAHDFCNNIYNLIIYDIANHKFQKGISILGNCSIPFLTSKNSHKISPKKVESFINTITHNFTKTEIDNVKDILNKSKKDFWYHIKGHFLSNAVINLIKYLVRKESGLDKSLNKDSLYALTIDCRENWENRIDIRTVVNKIKEI
jgi:hypothetical protein